MSTPDPTLPQSVPESAAETNGPTPAADEAPKAEEPDWQTSSDEAFLAAAKASFERNAELLRRLS